MADVVTAIEQFFASLIADPLYLLLLMGVVALGVIVLVALHIHKIRSEEIFVHQAWGAKWRGR